MPNYSSSNNFILTELMRFAGFTPIFSVLLRFISSFRLLFSPHTANDVFAHAGDRCDKMVCRTCYTHLFLFIDNLNAYQIGRAHV